MEIYIPIMADHWLKLLVCVLALVSSKANSQPGDFRVPLTLVEKAVEKGAVCLDGSPAGYHYAPGFGAGTDNWMVYLPGGGWCTSITGCIDRVKSQPEIATTTNVTNPFFGGILSPDGVINPNFYNWHRIYVRYCDGGSFLGDVEVVDPTSNLHLRGSRIFSAVIDELLSKGMSTAKNAALVGNSAGALATMLNCDRFRELVPSATNLKCIADSGFFVHAKDLPFAPQREHTFAKVIEFHGMTNFVPKECASRMDPSLCLFPENFVGDIKTPLFLLNTNFDKFQIQITLRPRPEDRPNWEGCTAQLETCTSGQVDIIKVFRNTFMDALRGVPDTPSRGLFINSCYIHDFIYVTDRWASEKAALENMTIAKAIGDWYFDRIPAVRLIDNQTDFPLDCQLSSQL